jgi:hypothetical protein
LVAVVSERGKIGRTRSTRCRCLRLPVACCLGRPSLRGAAIRTATPRPRPEKVVTTIRRSIPLSAKGSFVQVEPVVVVVVVVVVVPESRERGTIGAVWARPLVRYFWIQSAQRMVGPTDVGIRKWKMAAAPSSRGGSVWMEVLNLVGLAIRYGTVPAKLVMTMAPTVRPRTPTCPHPWGRGRTVGHADNLQSHPTGDWW